MLISELFVILFGLIIGSFLNVCIHRFPKNQSIVTPRSRCPECGHHISAWENIPIISYLLLGGKCRECRTPISWIYPVVEFLTALSLWLLFIRFGISSPFFVNVLFFSLLICLIFIDLNERILPDRLTLGGCVVGFLLAGFQGHVILGGKGSIELDNLILSNYLNSLLGMIVGGGVLWLVATLYLKIRKREGMGFGDIKMMMMVGAFLGWKLAWFTILSGSVIGVLFGGGFMYLFRKNQEYELPFGTFLGFGAMAATLYGNLLIDWYLSMM